MSDQDLFKQLSESLTGFERLDRESAEECFSLIKAHYPDELAKALAAFSDAHERLSNLTAVYEAIIMVWYTGSFADASGRLVVGSESLYRGGLVWASIGTRAPAFAQGQPGYWSEPSDEVGAQ
jgi:hypothetical protein